MQRHLIALDLDGTTLNSKSQLASETIATLHQLERAGHIVVIVTGRPYLISKHIYDALHLTSPMVNFNGALTHIPHKHWAGEQILNVSREMSLNLLDAKDQLGLKTLVAEDKLHVWADHPTDMLPEFLPVKLRDDQYLNAKNLATDPIALTIEFTPEQKTTILGQIAEHYGNFVEPRIWGGPYDIMELIHRGVHKEDGLDHVAKFYQIDRQNIIAFGDEQNDYEMIDYAGRGVAMKNAIPLIKEIADDETEYDNDHAGVARYLKAYFAKDLADLN
ncbi:Cof-type HAD-IIB family hydrolase [Lactobacillus sp. 3B(2020)]|uniref:Cof-type HAD-IIB family hydrolase n=1 Tax=Lactobacillus sp. 3B(2020) TaxID=2695882 RepID=UPI0015E04AB3|nr:Cof-type HAD-IIB family hydrolase [Lactobacillus sp. 3B(2020)]QLL69891.1 Cof-type HAD-IIB family hydrolase [Lactobacillus sp. 3B(2020)]